VRNAPKGAGSGANTDVEAFLAPWANPASGAQGRWWLGCGRQCPAVVAGLVERNLEVIEPGRPRPPNGAQLSSQACQAWAPQLRPLNWTSELPAAGPLPAADLVVNNHPAVGMAADACPWLQRSWRPCAARPLSTN